MHGLPSVGRIHTRWVGVHTHRFLRSRKRKPSDDLRLARASRLKAAEVVKDGTSMLDVKLHEFAKLCIDVASARYVGQHRCRSPCPPFAITRACPPKRWKQ